MRTCGFDALLGLLGYPGGFWQLTRLKKNFWMDMDGPPV